MGVVLLADPQVAAVAVRECGEPLVHLSEVGLRHAAVGSGALLRAGVAARLTAARRALPDGYDLVVVEGFRPREAQVRIVADYRATVEAAHPAATAMEVERLTSRFVAPVEVAPHVAGAAVDLTLTDADGVPLWMGTEVDATPEESDGVCWTDAAGLPAEVRHRRRVLGAAMEAAGLVNYPTEWWHWSFGDRYWALTTGAEAAVYGPCGTP